MNRASNEAAMDWIRTASIAEIQMAGEAIQRRLDELRASQHEPSGPVVPDRGPFPFPKSPPESSLQAWFRSEFPYPEEFFAPPDSLVGFPADTSKMLQKPPRGDLSGKEPIPGLLKVNHGRLG